MHKMFLVRYTRQWEFQIKAVMTRDFGPWYPSVDLLGLLFYSGHISVAIVTVITITAQDTPVENPRRKHAL